MIYLTLKPRVTFAPGKSLRLMDVAQVLADASLHAAEMPLDLPGEKGIWKLEAMWILKQMRAHWPDESITVLGNEIGYLHREVPVSRDPWRIVRTALLFLILMVGSALAVAWFHADVDMPRAQQALYQWITGREAGNSLWIALPYALGMGIGVMLYYALIGRKTVSPLDIKLNAYRSEVEENAGQQPKS
ncbi:MAG: hypothetical protein RR482_10265 [Clostridia bacterium]